MHAIIVVSCNKMFKITNCRYTHFVPDNVIEHCMNKYTNTKKQNSATPLNIQFNIRTSPGRSPGHFHKNTLHHPLNVLNGIK